MLEFNYSGGSMSLKSVKITGEKGDCFLLADLDGNEAKVRKSLVNKIEYKYKNGNIGLDWSIYKEWFKLDIDRTRKPKNNKKKNIKEKIKQKKKSINKYYIQYDYPVNKNGQGVSIEIYNENEETAKTEAEKLYKKQFKKEAKGKIIKSIRYNSPSEIKIFCKNKYGSDYPKAINCGQLQWLNVPRFSMAFMPMGVFTIPYLLDSKNKNTKECELLEKKLEEHMKLKPRPDPNKNRDIIFIPLDKEEINKMINKYPELIKFLELMQKWANKRWTLLKELTIKKGARQLRHKELELLGINFDIYNHEYQGGVKYIELTGKRPEVKPEFR